MNKVENLTMRYDEAAKKTSLEYAQLALATDLNQRVTFQTWRGTSNEQMTCKLEDP